VLRLGIVGAGDIGSRTDNPGTAEHGRHVLEIMLTCYESARSGKAIELTTTF
jgi:hypothetical protein